jgi:uncharacterized membrane protein
MFKKEIFVDETFTFFITNKLSFLQILSGIDTHPPVYYLLIKILPHANMYIIRFISLWIMVTGIALLYYVSKEIFSRKISLSIMFFAVLSETISYYSVEARMYSLLFLFGSCVMMFTFKEKYIHAIVFMALSFLTHYYGIFVVVPALAVMLYKKEYHKIGILIGVFFIISAFLIPYISHQINDNPYKMTPPHDPSNLITLVSMIVFPVVIPTMVDGIAMGIASLFILCFSLGMMFLIPKDNKPVFIYIITSFLVCFGIVFVSMTGLIPYHHRYLIVLFPALYLGYSLALFSIKDKAHLIVMCVLIFIMMLYVTVASQQNPENEFMSISYSLPCPANVLHETPFSMMPMMVYAPDCNHYLAKNIYWDYITNDSMFTEERFINNANVSYDYYISYFPELRGDYLLNSTDMNHLRVIKLPVS